MEKMHCGIIESESDKPRYVLCDPCNYEHLEAVADTFCHDCKEHLCPQCKHFHLKFQATRSHRMTTGYNTQEKQSKDLLLKLCDVHRTNEVRFYCQSHKCVLCSICKASIHSGCRSQLITEVTEQETDRHQLNLTRSSIKDLINSFQSSVQTSSQSYTDIEQTANEYKVKIFQMKDKLNWVLDQAAIGISIKEAEAKAHFAVKSQTDQNIVYNEALSDLETLLENIQDVLDSNDPVAVFSAKLKSLKLTEEYSFVNKNLKSRFESISVGFTQYQQLIDYLENCLSLCELNIKPTTEDKQTPLHNMPNVQGHSESHMANMEQLRQSHLNACFNTIQTNKIQSKASVPSQPDASQQPESIIAAETTQRTDESIQFAGSASSRITRMKISSSKLDLSNKPLSINPGNVYQEITTAQSVRHEDDSQGNISEVSSTHINPTENSQRTIITHPSEANIDGGQAQLTTTKDSLYSNIVKVSVSTEKVNVNTEKGTSKSFGNLKLSHGNIKIIKSKNDKKTCDITGSAFLQDGRLVLCDHQNMNVKLLNESLEVIDSFKVGAKPWDVTVTAVNEVAVTLPNNRVVQYFNITDSKIVQHRNFQVKKAVWGIDSFKDTVILSLFNIDDTHGGIEIRKHNGALVRQIDKNTSGKPFFMSPGYVTVNKQDGNIFVSDGKKNAIMCLTYEGTLLRTFEKASLRWPRKVISDFENNLIICARFADCLKLLPNKLSAVHQYRTFLGDCTRPQTISFRDTDMVLIVGSNTTDELLVLKYI